MVYCVVTREDCFMGYSAKAVCEDVRQVDKREIGVRWEHEMAKKLDGYVFAGCRNQQYPWNEWLNGNIWQLTKDVDFKSKCECFRTNAYGVAKLRGLKVRTQIVGTDIIIIQSYTNGKPQ